MYFFIKSHHFDDRSLWNVLQILQNICEKEYYNVVKKK